MAYAGPVLADFDGPLTEIDMGNGEVTLRGLSGNFLRIDNDGGRHWSPNQDAEERFTISGNFYVAVRDFGQRTFILPRVA